MAQPSDSKPAEATPAAKPEAEAKPAEAPAETVKPDDKLFAVLATGQPITVTGPIKPLKWGVKGLKPKVEAFLKGCRK